MSQRMNEPFDGRVDLAGRRLGASVVWANDELFAPKERLIDPAPPVDRPGVYGERGKWMDGWETRRRRQPGHDACILRLGLAGRIETAVVDTSHFRGNFPAACRLEGVSLPRTTPPAALLDDGLVWQPLLAESKLEGDARNRFELTPPPPAALPTTYVRFSILPDGGVARLRLLGEVLPDWPRLEERTGSGEIDLAAAEHGGRVVAASDAFFSDPRHLNLPGPPRGMDDGWETRRRRGPGHDWVVLRLGRAGVPRRVVVDTTCFVGNAPGSCWLDGAPGEEPPGGEPPTDDAWRPLLEETPLVADCACELDLPNGGGEPVSYVRLAIRPEGGVGRLRVFCTLEGAR
jgi:allantoicase